VTEKDPSDLAVMTFEMLKGIQSDVSDIKRDVGALKVRTSNVEMVLGHIQVSIGQLNGRMDGIDQRIGRIETRLDLVDGTKPAAE
jgi:hypothetical protein